ncbi:class I SAM-dependent methyltransferase [Oceanobacillus damuensis]|uniref:SAM-dependent methyltransferase n=1 Tax=Oceanobacillus damuensis TaxID=937928 RepID=UPI00082C6DE6|nr:SAM-dependent methyltransferase [Oceanobacillus damuensis]
MNEYKFDKLMHIRTGAEKKVSYPDSVQYNPYEPTPYDALEILFQHYKLGENDQVVDYGCGKGRLNFYIHYFFGVSAKGIEMDENAYQKAIDNQRSYLKYTNKKENTIEFFCCLAEEYRVEPNDNRFYFFNPFSVIIFRKVIHNILRSAEKAEREVELILYYPHEDYIYFLENNTSFELKKEVPLQGLYEKNPDERFLIYRLVF